MSMASNERRVMSFFSRSRVFSFSRKASTMLVPAEPSPITWTLFWYIRVVMFGHIPTMFLSLSLTLSKLDEMVRSILEVLRVSPSRSFIWSSMTSVM